MTFTFPGQTIILDIPKLPSILFSTGAGYSTATRLHFLGIPLWIYLIILGYYVIKPLIRRFPRFPIEEHEHPKIRSINNLYVVTVIVFLAISFLETATTSFNKEYATFYAVALVLGLAIMLYLKNNLKYVGWNIAADNRLFNVFPNKPREAVSLIILSIPLLLILSNLASPAAVKIKTAPVSYATDNIENKLLSAFVAPVEDLILIRLIGLASMFLLLNLFSQIAIKVKGLTPPKTFTTAIITLYNQNRKTAAAVISASIVLSSVFLAEVVAVNFHQANYSHLAPQIAARYEITEEEAMDLMLQQVSSFWFWSSIINLSTGSIIAVDVNHAVNNWATA